MASTTKKKTTTTTTTATKLPPNPFIFEILEVVGKQRGNAKKVELLQQYRTDALVSILIWNFDDSIISMLPEGEVPFNRNDVPVGTDHTSLRKEWKNLYHFVKGGNDSLSKTRRESMFIQLLEGLHADEADLICKVKDRRLEEDYKINLSIIKEAYPDIKWGWRK